MKKWLVISVATMALTGCASVPMADEKQDQALKAFTVAPDKAGLYIYRNESIGAGVKMTVSVDGQTIGQTAAKTYLFREVTPGRHTVSSAAENTDSLEVNARPGTLTYIWQEVKMGMLYARTRLHLVDEATGRQGVRESRLATGQ